MAEAIGRALIANGRGRLVTLEHDATLVAVARARCHGLPVDVLECDSASWAPEPGESIDFAWLDSQIISRVHELARLRTRFSPGAIVGIHEHRTATSRWLGFAQTCAAMARIGLRTPRASRSWRCRQRCLSVPAAASFFFHSSTAKGAPLPL